MLYTSGQLEVGHGWVVQEDKVAEAGQVRTSQFDGMFQEEHLSL
jgi:hypothetical protein